MKSQVVLLAGVLALGASSLALADWPNFRGPTGNSTAAAASVPDQIPAGGWKELWKAPLGDSFGQIAVAGDKAVTFIKRGDNEVAVCLNAATGKEIWAQDLGKTIKDGNGDGPRSTPTIDGERVYAYGTNMTVFCLELGSGKEVWKHDIQGEAGGKAPKWGNATSPVVVGDHVIIVGGGKGKGIMAFDKQTGQGVWAATDEKLTHATPTVATIAGQLQVICFMQSGLVAVNPQSGAVLWKFGHPYSISTAASPVVGGKDGDIVYCSAGYKIGAAACRVTKDNGVWTATKIWRTDGLNMNHWSTPVYYNGFIYGLFNHNDPKGPLACLDIETGQVKWSKAGFGSQGGIILVGDKLLVQTPSGELVLAAAAPDEYKELGRMKVFGGKNWTMPAYSDGKLFVRNTAEGICLELSAK